MNLCTFRQPQLQLDLPDTCFSKFKTWWLGPSRLASFELFFVVGDWLVSLRYAGPSHFFNNQSDTEKYGKENLKSCWARLKTQQETEQAEQLCCLSTAQQTWADKKGEEIFFSVDEDLHKITPQES